MKKLLAILLICCFTFSTTVFAAVDTTNIGGLHVTPIQVNDGTLIGYKVTYNANSVENIGTDGILLFINGSIVEWSGAVIQNNRVLVPVRVISETLNTKVNWFEETQTVTIVDGNTTVELVIGNTEAKINGEPFTLDVEPTIINNSTYVPLRFISEALDAEVVYSNGTDDSPTYLIDELAQVMISRYEDDQEAISKETAIDLVYADLVYAYEKRFGIQFEPTDEPFDTSSYPGDEDAFRYTFSHLTVTAETDRYYIIPVVFDFWVDKYTGDIYVYYNGQGKMVTPFDKDSEFALAFAG